MTFEELDALARRANQAGFQSIPDYCAQLEGALREIEPVAKKHNVLIWTVVRAALAGEWRPMRGPVVD